MYILGSYGSEIGVTDLPDQVRGAMDPTVDNVDRRLNFGLKVLNDSRISLEDIFLRELHILWLRVLSCSLVIVFRRRTFWDASNVHVREP